MGLNTNTIRIYEQTLQTIKKNISPIKILIFLQFLNLYFNIKIMYQELKLIMTEGMIQILW
ncbi:unnamed protein product [Paramecium sonneborni]|uniref:Uncharacterized protein n=1 Tax=Paramecium sonneborni TaxID=65129 RepID=A0A8S1QVG7_9CILI|nr:unnamed protein product [Paramecium sonneborni]